MRNSSYTQIIESSFQRTKGLFLNPFSVKRWLILLFIAVTAGQMTGGGGSAKDWADIFRGKFFEKEASAQVADDEQAPAVSSAGETQLFKEKIRLFWNENRGRPLILILLGVVALLVIFLIFFVMWISARFYFVWLHCLLSGHIEIKKPFREYKKEGWSFFLFMTVAGFLFLLMFSLAMVWMVFTFGSMVADSVKVFSWHKLPTVIFGVLFLSIVLLAGVMFMFFVNHFVIPIMLVRRSGVIAAWKDFRDLIKANAGDVVLLVLIVFGLSILCNILGLIIILFIGLAGALVAALFGGILYFLFNVLLSVQYAGNIMLVVLGMAWGATVLVAMAASYLPFVVFLRYVTLHFLASLDPAYAQLQFVPPAADEHHEDLPSVEG